MEASYEDIIQKQSSFKLLNNSRLKIRNNSLILNACLGPTVGIMSDPYKYPSQKAMACRIYVSTKYSQIENQR